MLPIRGMALLLDDMFKTGRVAGNVATRLGIEIGNHDQHNEEKECPSYCNDDHQGQCSSRVPSTGEQCGHDELAHQ